jgi:hypothetical protein
MLGVIKESVGSSDSDYFLIKSLNKLSKQNINCYLFVDKIEYIYEHDFAILPLVEAMSHKGTLISSSILTTQILDRNLTADKKYFYVESFEWMNVDNLYSSQLKNIYLNEDIELISPSKHYDFIISSLFKKPKMIMRNWEMQYERFL